MADVHVPVEHIRIVSGATGFIPHILARAREDGLWEAWIEFRPEAGGPSCATGRETTQPNLTAIKYWAEGLEPIYFEGAFARATTIPVDGPYGREPESRLSRKY
jgi:hypothetical protein